MFSNLHIDWISLTIPLKDTKQREALSDIQLWQKSQAKVYTCDSSKWRPTKPMFGYSEAYQSECGTVAMYGRVEMGLHVIYSGQALYQLGVRGIMPEGILENGNRFTGRCTRCDIALDIFDGTATVDTFQSALLKRLAVTTSKTWRTMASSQGGNTLYVGSRASERMVRVYDKKAERAAAFVEVGSDSWIRVEAELKGQQAENFMKALRDNEIEAVMTGHLRSAIDFPSIADWREAMANSGAEVVATETKRKDTKTRHWLLTTVANTLATESADDIEFLTQFNIEVKSLINDILKKRDSKSDNR